MNDKEEVIHFIKLYENKLIGELDHKYHDECRELFNKAINMVTCDYPYVVCFTTLDDDVAQWERYAHNARGVCITFDWQKIGDYFNNQGLYMFLSVQYPPDISSNVVYEAIKDYLETGESPTSLAPNIDWLMSNIISTGAFMKHPSFSSEKEVRTVDFKKSCDKSYTIDHKLVNGRIKEVLKLPLERLNELITEIKIGPRSQQSEFELNRFIKACGFEISVSTSKCPLR